MALTASVIVYTVWPRSGHTVSTNSVLLVSVSECLLNTYFDLLKLLFYRCFFDNFESSIGIVDSSKSLIFKMMEMLHVKE